MSYHIYTTEAVILDSFAIGEANRAIRMFTRALGLISATAQSVRKESSKLRFHLQDHTITNVSLVHGKEMWRITNAHGAKHLMQESKIDFNARVILIRVYTLIKRMVQGEEKNEDLFNVLLEIIRAISDSKNNIENYLQIERASTIKILNALGYWRDDGGLKEITDSYYINSAVLKLVSDNSIIADQKVRNALVESHL